MTTPSALRSTLFLAAMLLSVAAQAQIFRAYLASDGSDANPCTLQLPCRLLPAALTAVASGGEIWMLDSANYNTTSVTVGKSVTILAVPGALGSVVAAGGSAISITATGLKVALRNLVIVPLPGGGGIVGINMTGTSTLIVENSLIANLPQDGVLVSGSGRLKVTNSIIRNNGSFAVSLVNGARAEISGTQLLENAFGGVTAQGSQASFTRAYLTDSVIAEGIQGVLASTAHADAVTIVAVTRCTIVDSLAFALRSQTTNVGTATITIGNSMISTENAAWEVVGTGAIIRTLGNNQISDIGGVNSGVLTPLAPQ